MASISPVTSLVALGRGIIRSSETVKDHCSALHCTAPVSHSSHGSAPPLDRRTRGSRTGVPLQYPADQEEGRYAQQFESSISQVHQESKVVVLSDLWCLSSIHRYIHGVFTFFTHVDHAPNDREETAMHTHTTPSEPDEGENS